MRGQAVATAGDWVLTAAAWAALVGLVVGVVCRLFPGPDRGDGGNPVKRHLWWMVGGALVVLAVLLAVGLDPGQAARWALALACPLGMVGMMAVMGKGAGHVAHGTARGTASSHDHATGAQQLDPVCGMTVDPARAVATRERDGVRYFFCSAGCAAAFDSDPARHLLA